MARAGLSAALVNGMVNITSTVRARPIENGAIPLGAFTEVAPRTTATSNAVASASRTSAVPMPKTATPASGKAVGECSAKPFDAVDNTDLAVAAGSPVIAAA